MRFKKSIVFMFLSAVLLTVFISGIPVNAKVKQALNNGGYFIGADQQIYYRYFDKKSLERTALWGDYMLNPTGKGNSKIMVYDKKTGKSKELFADNSTKIFYLDNKFYLTKENINGSTAYRVDKNGKNYKKLSSGEVVGCSDYNHVVVQDIKDHRFILRIFKNDKPLISLTSKDSELIYVDIKDKYLIYRTFVYEGSSRQELWCKDLSNKSKPVKLGTLPQGDSGYNYLGMPRQVLLAKQKTLYITVDYLEGSGAYFSKGYLFKAIAGKEDSLKVQERVDADGDIYTMYHVYLDSTGKLKKTKHLANEVVIDENNNLCWYKKDGLKKKIYPKFLPKSKGNIRYNAEYMTYIDGRIFIILNKEKYSESDSIGWRDAYQILERKYINIDVNNPKSLHIMHTDKFN